MAEREIDIIDLMFHILLKWRVILVWMLVGGILMSGLSYVRSYQRQKAWSEAGALEQQQDEGEYLRGQLTDVQINNVNAALGYESGAEIWESYLHESVKMQIDALNEPRAVLTFKVVAEDSETAYQMEQIYEDAVLGGLSLWLADDDQNEISAAAMSELAVLDKNSENNLTNITPYRDKDSFSIIIYHLSEEQCLELVEKVEEYLYNQNSHLVKTLGNHEIQLVNRTFSFVMDTILLGDQQDIQNNIITLNNNAAKLKNDFSDEEWQYYDYMKTKDVQEGSEVDQAVSASPDTHPAVNVKYVLVGLFLFAFLYIVLAFVKYIMNGKLQLSDDVNTIYGVPGLGVIPQERNAKKAFAFVDQWILKLRDWNKRKFAPDKAIGLAATTVKIAAKKEGLEEVCCIGCDMQDRALKVADDIQTVLKEENISMRVVNNVLYDQEAMEQLLSAKGAFLLERAEGTLYSEMERELEILRRQDIKVLGVIVME